MEKVSKLKIIVGDQMIPQVNSKKVHIIPQLQVHLIPQFRVQMIPQFQVHFIPHPLK